METTSDSKTFSKNQFSFCLFDTFDRCDNTITIQVFRWLTHPERFLQVSNRLITQSVIKAWMSELCSYFERHLIP